MTTRRITHAAITLIAALAVVIPSAGAAVPGTSAWHVRGAHNRGALPARRMTITFALAPRNASQLKRLASSHHRALTRTQFISRFGPSKQTVKRIRTWATAHRLRVRSLADPRPTERPDSRKSGKPKPRLTPAGAVERIRKQLYGK